MLSFFRRYLKESEITDIMQSGKFRIDWKMVNWPAVLFLFLTPPLALGLSIYYVYRDGFQWQIWALAAVFYALTASSITAGYHRLFAHRTYQARGWVKWIWALFGAAAFQNSILIWARDHRVHHRFVDSDHDPYSISKGFFYAHFGWMLSTAIPDVDMKAYERDLKLDPIIMFQHRHYILLASIMCFVVPTVLGYCMGSALGGLAVAGLARVVALHHMTFFVNSWCHYWGKQTYTDTNTAKDSFVMAVATFGEGYHNFHHYFANDYRNGVRWYHWDPTKWVIALFFWVGGTHSLRRTPWSEIITAQMRMDEKRLKTQLSATWHDQLQQQLDLVKARFESAYQRWEQLRAEYKQFAKNYARSKREHYAELKFQLRLAKIEFRAALKQWRAYHNFLSQLQPGVS